MKKTFLIVAIALLAASVYSQGNKKDSVQTKIIYLFDNRDTVKVNTLIYKGDNGILKWCSPGWEIRVGRAYIGDDKKKYWADNYTIESGLDDKKRPVKTIN